MSIKKTIELVKKKRWGVDLCSFSLLFSLDRFFTKSDYYSLQEILFTKEFMRIKASQIIEGVVKFCLQNLKHQGEDCLLELCKSIQNVKNSNLKLGFLTKKKYVIKPKSYFGRKSF
jgi:hypothetical protein